MKNKDIKRMLVEQAEKIQIEDNLMKTKAGLPDFEPVKRGKATRPWGYALAGAAACLVIGLGVGLPLGLKGNGAPAESGSGNIGLQLSSKELSSFGYQALSSFALLQDEQVKGMLFARKPTQEDFEKAANEVVEYMGMVESFSNKGLFSFVEDGLGFEIFLGGNGLFDLTLNEETHGDTTIYTGTIEDLDSGKSYPLRGKKETEPGEEEIEVTIYQSETTYIVSTQQIESEVDELETSYSYAFYSGGRCIKNVEYETEVEGAEAETELKVVDESGNETSVSFEYLGDMSKGYQCEFESDLYGEFEMDVKPVEGGHYQFSFEGGYSLVI